MKKASVPALALSLVACQALGCHKAPKAEVVGSTEVSVRDLRMDDQAFYFLERGTNPGGRPANDGAVARMPKASGKLSKLVSGQSFADHIAIDDTDVYWSHTRHEQDEVKGIVSRVPKSGGPSADLFDTERSVEALSVDATDVFLAVGQIDGRIVRIPKKGGAPVELAGGQQNPRGLALDRDGVLWLNIAGSGTKSVRRVPKAGGEPTILATVSQAGSSEHLEVVGPDVYFLDGSTLMAVPISGGASRRLADHVAEFGVDDKTLYYTLTNDQYFMKLPPGADKPERVAYDMGAFASSFVFDTDSVYWTAPADHQIRRSHK